MRVVVSPYSIHPHCSIHISFYFILFFHTNHHHSHTPTQKSSTQHTLDLHVQDTAHQPPLDTPSLAAIAQLTSLVSLNLSGRTLPHVRPLSCLTGLQELFLNNVDFPGGGWRLHDMPGQLRKVSLILSLLCVCVCSCGRRCTLLMFATHWNHLYTIFITRLHIPYCTCTHSPPPYTFPIICRSYPSCLVSLVLNSHQQQQHACQLNSPAHSTVVPSCSIWI